MGKGDAEKFVTFAKSWDFCSLHRPLAGASTGRYGSPLKKGKFMSDKPVANCPETASPAKGDKKWVKTGVAVGIGSAAIVAALLYANRSKDSKKS